MPFAARQRGGKKAKKAEARARDTEAGLRQPQEGWSEEKRAAYARLQDLQNRRRQLVRLEAEALDVFRKASAEDPEAEESLPSAPRGSGSGGDLEEEEVEVEVGPEGEGEGIYSAASVGARGAYSDQALGRDTEARPKPTSGGTRGRSRTRSPKPSARTPGSRS